MNGNNRYISALDFVDLAAQNLNVNDFICFNLQEMLRGLQICYNGIEEHNLKGLSHEIVEGLF